MLHILKTSSYNHNTLFSSRNNSYYVAIFWQEHLHNYADKEHGYRYPSSQVSSFGGYDRQKGRNQGTNRRVSSST